MIQDNLTAPLVVSSSGATNRGHKRPHNEDSFIAEYPVFLVADGMGGHEAGDIASAIVIDCFRQFVGRESVTPSEIVEAVATAQSRVGDLSDSRNRGAGSTVTGAISSRDTNGDRTWVIVNLGDSRTYRASVTGVEQVTRDHSLQQELIARGEADSENVGAIAQRNVITKAVGDRVSIPDLWALPFVNGERILVCSDGLTTEVSDDEVERVLGSTDNAELAAGKLVAAALAHEGRDNVTVVVVDVIEGGLDRAYRPSRWYEFGVAAQDADDAEDTDTIPRERVR